jgi:hypothetical protein
MGAIYGHRWVSAYGDDPCGVAGMAWTGALDAMSRAQIDTGLRACVDGIDGWPPSLPEFRALCLGIPSLAAVRAEMRPGHPSPSRFCRGVWSRIDGWSYQRAEQRQADAMLREAYELTCAAVLAGGPLPDDPVAEINQQQPERKPPATPEQMAAHLRQIEAELLGAAS